MPSKLLAPFVITILNALPAVAESATPSWLGENLRASVDASARVIHADGRTWTLAAVGTDVHKVVTGSRGDIGTLVFQPYMLRIDNAPMAPPIFEDGDDTALQWRITNFNYTGVGRGRFNLRVGHFELPFGLEHVVPTNGTLHQMNAPANTVLKTDWGISINGVLPSFEYEFAAMRGSGNDFRTDAEGIVVGRIGSGDGRAWRAGISFLNGEVDTGSALVQVERVGVDTTLRLPRGLELAAEYARGHNDDISSNHLLAELGWRSPAETTFAYVQWRKSRINAPDADRQRVDLGLRFEPNRHWSLSGQLSRGLGRSSAASDLAAMAQLRYRI